MQLLPVILLAWFLQTILKIVVNINCAQYVLENATHSHWSTRMTDLKPEQWLFNILAVFHRLDISFRFTDKCLSA